MNDLIHISVDDARSSLKCAELNGHLNIAALDANILALRALAESGFPQPTKFGLLLATRGRWIKLIAKRRNLTSAELDKLRAHAASHFEIRNSKLP